MANPRNLANIAPNMNGSGGNVGIGTASPSAKLDVSTTGSAGVFTTTQTSGNAVTINVDGSSGTPVGLRVAAGFGTIGSTAKLINVVDSAGGNLFNAQASGVIGVGSGIAFPATQVASTNANTLDDYEEGTFTVTTNGDATGAFSAQSGEYTKIGNVCTVRIAFSVSVNFTSAVIGGLPFTVAGSSSVSGVGFLGSVITGSSNESPIIAECDVATIVVSFYAVGDRGIAHEPNTTNDVYRLSMVYRTT